MNTNEIKIIVLGRTGSGKSTISNLITKFLIENKVEVEYSMEFSDKQIEDRMSALKDKNLNVEIIEIQSNSEPKVKHKNFGALKRLFNNVRHSSGRRVYNPTIKKE